MNKEVFWFRNNMKLMQVSRRYRHGNTYLYLHLEWMFLPYLKGPIKGDYYCTHED